MAQIVSHLHGGGKEQCVVTLANALARNGVSSVVVSLEPPGRLRDLLAPAVRFHTLGKRPGNDLSIPFRLASIFRREDVSIVHCHNWGTLVESVLAAKLSRVRGVVYTQHGLDYESGRRQEQSGRMRRRMLKRLALSSVDQVVAVSREVQDLAVRGWGVSARKVQVVHNGVPEISPRLTPAERAALRNELGFSPSDFVVGSVGGFRPVKNFPTLVECLARSREQMPTLKLLLVGDGSGRAAIEERVRHHRLHGIVVLPGWRADVPRLLQVMDLFALPSLSEGISLSILEAMMAGLPVVATHVGGNPEIVEHQATGLLVPVDPRAIAEAILSLAGDINTRTRMGRLARERAETRFTEARMARDYQRVYGAATE